MTALWIVSLALPAGLGIVLALAGAARGAAARRVRARMVAVSGLTTLPAGVLALLADTGDRLELPWLLLGSHLQLDEVAQPLLLVASLLYAAALVAVHVARLERADALAGFLLVCFVGNALVFTAADVATFYLGFAVMSFAAYGLVLHDRSPAAERAGRVYLVLTVLSELLVLAAVVLVAAEGGAMLADAPGAVAASEHRDLLVLLLLAGFGIKAGTVPLHVWLPLAHPAAPPPASAVLSGAMVKAGLVGWLRFLPLGEVSLPVWGVALTSLALVGAFAALPLGAVTSDTKVALAYSSVSQMGFLAVLVGTALADPELAEACALAAVVYAVHHGLAKGALFLGITVWGTHGGGPLRWWVLGGLGLAALAVAGAPLGSGAVAKYAAKQAVDPAGGLFGLELIDLLPLVGTASTILLARAGWLLLTRGSRAGAQGVDSELLGWSLLVVVGGPVTWVAAERWAPVVAVPGLDAVTLWDATWPLLLGLLVSAATWAAWRRGLLGDDLLREAERLLPAGDLVVPEEAALRRLARARRRLGDRVAARGSAVASAVSGPAATAYAATVRGLDRGEDLLERWRVAGGAILATGALVTLVLWWWR